MPAPRRWHEQSLVFNDFSGGENYTDSEIKLLPNELSECRNYVPDKRGALKKRLGISKYNAVEFGLGSLSPMVYGLIRFYRESGADKVIATGRGTTGAAIFDVPATGAATNLGSATGYYLDTAETQMVQYRNRIYGCASPQSPYGRNDNFVVAEHPGASTALLAWRMGVTVPTKAGTHAESEDSGGLTAGVYLYKFAYFYGEDGAHGESNPSASSTITITGSNDTNTITIWADDADHEYDDWDEAHNHGVDKVRIYRSEVDESDYCFLADVTSGNTHEDKTADADLDDTTIPQADNYPPDIGRYLCVHQDRLVMGYLNDETDRFPKRVRWSLAGSPDIWPANNHADSPAEHGDITGLAVIAGQLYVFYESAIARLTLYGAADNEFEIVTTTAGCWAPNTLAVGEELNHEVAFFMAADGHIYVFDGVRVARISRAIKARLEEYTPWGDGAFVCGGWDGESYRLGYQALKGAQLMTKGWELRYNTKVRKLDPYTQENLGTWWPQWLAVDEIPLQYCRFDGGSDEGALYWASESSGFIFKSDSGNSDDGTNISYHFYTAYRDAGDPGMEKNFGSMAIDCESESSLTVTWDTDWGDATDSFTTKEQSDPIRTDHDPAGRISFRYVRIKVEGSDSSAPSTVYALVLNLGAARPARKKA